MIRTIAVFAMLSATPALAHETLFPDFAVSSIRANHPEFDRNPINVTCRTPGGRVTYFRREPVGMGLERAGPVVERIIDDARCEYPSNYAMGATHTTEAYAPVWHAPKPVKHHHKKVRD